VAIVVVIAYRLRELRREAREPAGPDMSAPPARDPEDHSLS
jgi:hypothetical protein